MMEEKTEGILLHALPYLGHQKILKVFTPEGGLVSLIAKSRSLTPLTAPFLVAEWVYKKGKEDLHLLKEASLLHSLGALRDSYSALLAAGAIAQDLLRSQFPGKKGTGLYALTLAYLKKLSTSAQPPILVASFRLKLLVHEGWLALQTHCNQCPSPASHLSQGESACPAHAGLRSLSFAPEEWNTLQALAYARQFSVLNALSLSQGMQEKIQMLFEEKIR